MKTTRSPKAKSYMPSWITKEAKSRGRMPRPWDYQNHLLQLEETLFGHGWRTYPATQRAGRGKQKAQKHVRRPGP
jgi:hypothetical protein